MREDNLFSFEIQFMLIRKKQGMIGHQGEIVETVLGLGTTSEIEPENINAKSRLG